MMSRPNFEVDIVKSNGRTLSFTCSYLHPEEQQGGEEQGPGQTLFTTGLYQINPSKTIFPVLAIYAYTPYIPFLFLFLALLCLAHPSNFKISFLEENHNFLNTYLDMEKYCT
jgi:hypothetical protein